MNRLNPRRAAGFTLIEIMLVLVVMSIMASLLVVSMGDRPGKQLQREAERLQAVLQLAADEAVMQGVELALALTATRSDDQSGYQWLRFNIDEQQWQLLEGKPFDTHLLARDIRLDIQPVNDEQSALFQQQLALLQKLGASRSPQPQLMLLSSGEITPFEITLRHPGSTDVFILVCDGVSGIELL